jgi:hypothetical protein
MRCGQSCGLTSVLCVSAVAPSSRTCSSIPGSSSLSTGCRLAPRSRQNGSRSVGLTPVVINPVVICFGDGSFWTNTEVVIQLASGGGYWETGLPKSWSPPHIVDWSTFLVSLDVVRSRRAVKQSCDRFSTRKTIFIRRDFHTFNHGLLSFPCVFVGESFDASLLQESNCCLDETFCSKKAIVV